MQKYLFHPQNTEINDFFRQNINNFNKSFQVNEESVQQDIRWKHPQPASISNHNQNWTLHFEFPLNLVFGPERVNGIVPAGNTTRFSLTQPKGISKIKYAYVVLFYPNYNGSVKNYEYLLTTLLVGHLLREQKHNIDAEKGTLAKTIVMITPDINDPCILSLLKAYFDEVLTVPYISSMARGSDTVIIQDVSKGNVSRSHAYHSVFTKLHVFDARLFPYDKVVLLDSDLYPMCYFDTLFSLDTPAGWLEHKRMLHPQLGISSWIYDRQTIVPHGTSIPSIFTDIENAFASDINASLWVIKPNTVLFESMISELKTPLEKWFTHRGFWLGNQFFDHYRLPEQNYVTKRLSGQWKAVELGFCSWLLDLEYSFGFTFAGFVTKPWKIQSAFQNYHINPLSEFSLLNNKFTQRATGLSLFNNLLYRMIKSSPVKKLMVPFLSYLQITRESFDPWEPPATFSDLTPLRAVPSADLSYDQKKLASLSDTKIELGVPYIIDVIARALVPIYFTTLNRELIKIFYSVCKYFFPFGNSLISLIQTQYFDFTDDDNDFLILVKSIQEIKELISKLAKIPHLQLYVRLRNLTFQPWSENINIRDILFFNISFSENYVKSRFPNANDYWIHNHFSTLKLPWIDIFFVFTSNEPLIKFPNGTYISSYLFHPVLVKKIMEKNTELTFFIPSDMGKFCLEYYGNRSRLDFFQIKSHHSSEGRKIIAKIPIHQISPILEIFHQWNQHLKKIDHRKF